LEERGCPFEARLVGPILEPGCVRTHQKDAPCPDPRLVHARV